MKQRKKKLLLDGKRVCEMDGEKRKIDPMSARMMVAMEDGG